MKLLHRAASSSSESLKVEGELMDHVQIRKALLVALRNSEFIHWINSNHWDILKSRITRVKIAIVHKHQQCTRHWIFTVTLSGAIQSLPYRWQHWGLTRVSHLPKCGGLQKRPQLSIHRCVCHIAITWQRGSAALPTKRGICSPNPLALWSTWTRRKQGRDDGPVPSTGLKRPAMFLLVLLEPWHDYLYKAWLVTAEWEVG